MCLAIDWAKRAHDEWQRVSIAEGSARTRAIELAGASVRSRSRNFGVLLDGQS
jgi:hypothetical protein